MAKQRQKDARNQSSTPSGSPTAPLHQKNPPRTQQRIAPATFAAQATLRFSGRDTCTPVALKLEGGVW